MDQLLAAAVQILRHDDEIAWHAIVVPDEICLPAGRVGRLQANPPRRALAITLTVVLHPVPISVSRSAGFRVTQH